MTEFPNNIREHRRIRRKPGKRGTVVSCRKGTLGLGPNLALGIKELSAEGTQLLVKEWITPQTEVEIGLAAAGVGKPIVKMGVVVWCNPMESGFLLGVRFREQLAYMDFFNLS